MQPGIPGVAQNWATALVACALAALLVVGSRWASARLRRPWMGQLLVVMAVVWAVRLAWKVKWTGDDAFISFRYAANWAAGHGLVWNPGERVEG